MPISSNAHAQIKHSKLFMRSPFSRKYSESLRYAWMSFRRALPSSSEGFVRGRAPSSREVQVSISPASLRSSITPIFDAIGLRFMMSILLSREPLLIGGGMIGEMCVLWCRALQQVSQVWGDGQFHRSSFCDKCGAAFKSEE